MNVFIVENLLDMRKGLRSALSDMPKVKVVGHAMNETLALERIGALLPDVVLLSLGLQSSSGVCLLESVKKYYAAIRVIVLTARFDDTYTETCMYARADIIFDKSQFMQLREILSNWERSTMVDNPRHSRPVMHQQM